MITLHSGGTAWVEHVNIYDANGRLALSLQVPMNASLNAPITIDISSLASGRYTVELTNGKIRAITPLIKE